MDEIEEVKIHKNKETQRFRCQVLQREGKAVVLRYRSGSEGRIADMVIAKGSTTIAYYREGRTYVLWRMFAADGSLIGSLFHICTGVAVSDSRVTWHDLLLDIWITPEGAVRVLDEDELLQCLSAGLLTPAESAIVSRTRQQILADPGACLREAEEFEARTPPALS